MLDPDISTRSINRAPRGSLTGTVGLFPSRKKNSSRLRAHFRARTCIAPAHAAPVPGIVFFISLSRFFLSRNGVVGLNGSKVTMAMDGGSR